MMASVPLGRRVYPGRAARPGVRRESLAPRSHGAQAAAQPSADSGVRLTGGYGQHRGRLLRLLRRMGLAGGFPGPHARRGELVSPAGSGAGSAPARSLRLTRIMNSAMIRISARMPAETR
jgi:hypothetical protein